MAADPGRATKSTRRAAQPHEVFDQHEAHAPVIDAHQVETAAAGEPLQIAIQEDDGDAGPVQGTGNLPVGLVHARRQLDGGEEDAGHLLRDVSFAKPLDNVIGLLDRPRRGVAPKKGKVLRLHQPGDLGADGLENLGSAQTRDQEAELPICQPLAARRT